MTSDLESWQYGKWVFELDPELSSDAVRTFRTVHRMFDQDTLEISDLSSSIGYLAHTLASKDQHGVYPLLGVTIDGLCLKDAGFALGSDADGDLYSRNSGALVRIAKGTPNTIYWGARDNGLPMIVVWGAPLTTAPTPAPIPVVQTELTESVDLTSSDMGEQEGAAPTAPPAETPPVDLWMLILLAIAIVIVILAVVAIVTGWFT